jgi:hypothetical protein
MAGMFVATSWVLVAAWVAIAIPTSLIAHRLGHPRWIAYIAWCPFWGAFLFQVLPFHRGWIILFSWLPGAAYLWVLALKK